MIPIVVPDDFNYIGVFLTFDCGFSCPYCINKHGTLNSRKSLGADDWIKGLSRLQYNSSMPITLQGGEPTSHSQFYRIANALAESRNVDLMTNLDIDVIDFMSNVPRTTFLREAPYASIRVSYHDSQHKFYDLLWKVIQMQERGYDIGIWELDIPGEHERVLFRKSMAEGRGIDYRLKDFLGPWKGEYYGDFRYADAVNSTSFKSCSCRTSELLVAPDGNLHRCHADLYSGLHPIGNIMDDVHIKVGEWLPCVRYGQCNACDIKIKNNRYQVHGHTSVEIKELPTSSDSGASKSI